MSSRSMRVLLAACAASMFTADSARGVDIYASSRNSRQIVRVDTATGNSTVVRMTTGAPYGILLDNQGYLVYDLADVNHLYRFDPATGNEYLLTNGLGEPLDMVLDPGGVSVLVSNQSSGTITRTNLVTGQTTVLANIPSPSGLAYDKSGRLFVFGGFNTPGNQLYQLDPNTGAVLKTSGPIDSTNTLGGMTFDPFTGYLYGTSLWSGILWKIDPTTFYATSLVTLPHSSGYEGPRGVVSDGRGLLYIASRFDSSIYSFNLQTQVLTKVAFVECIDYLALSAPPDVTKTFDPTAIPLGGQSKMTITIANPNAFALNGLSFTDTLPAGLVVSGPSGLTNSCGGTATAVPGSGVVSLAGVSLSGGASCSVIVYVTGTAGGIQQNCVAINGGTPVCAQLVVTLAPVTPPTIGKVFVPGTVLTSQNSTMTFTITNPNTTTALTGVGFNDGLPAGVVVSTPNGLTGSCDGGVITAAAGSATVSLSGATLAAGGSCTFSVSVNSAVKGDYQNCVKVTSANGGPGNTACAVLHVVDPPPEDPDPRLLIRYFSNLDRCASGIDISNGGTSGAVASGNLCANVYVFDPDEQLLSCCSCLVSPNSSKSLSLCEDIVPTLFRPMSGNSLLVKLVGSSPAGSTCDASAVTSASAAPGLSAWATTVHVGMGIAGGSGITETPFANAGLSRGELTNLSSLCGFLRQSGSGYGMCKVCRDGF